MKQQFTTLLIIFALATLCGCGPSLAADGGGQYYFIGQRLYAFSASNPTAIERWRQFNEVAQRCGDKYCIATSPNGRHAVVSSPRTNDPDAGGRTFLWNTTEDVNAVVELPWTPDPQFLTNEWVTSHPRHKNERVTLVNVTTLHETDPLPADYLEPLIWNRFCISNTGEWVAMLDDLLIRGTLDGNRFVETSRKQLERRGVAIAWVCDSTILLVQDEAGAAAVSKELEVLDRLENADVDFSGGRIDDASFLGSMRGMDNPTTTWTVRVVAAPDGQLTTRPIPTVPTRHGSASGSVSPKSDMCLSRRGLLLGVPGHDSTLVVYPLEGTAWRGYHGLKEVSDTAGDRLTQQGGSGWILLE